MPERKSEPCKFICIHIIFDSIRNEATGLTEANKGTQLFKDRHDEKLNFNGVLFCASQMRRDY